ncbi:Zinc knuckle CX2CX4HX4C [Corchorus capsularis]|uniref:Zinc knuckle CX2CX4HX4C n=1 Tax=Corchorus capsularis TaxID=210143 RepID=A0A1R3HLX2_COCAP|nr:Zinc knuckle CX2CX4HX4C [Corchorus capsularis]
MNSLNSPSLLAPPSEPSGEEADLLQRSTKRIKETVDAMEYDEDASVESASHAEDQNPMDFADNGAVKQGASVSYKDKLLLRIDANIMCATRGRYARICIQVDLDTPLIHSVKIGKYRQPVLYESLAGLCFKCGCIGHNEKACPSFISVSSKVNIPESNPLNFGAGTSSMEDDNTPTEEDNGNSKSQEPTSQYGPWMVVSRRRQRPVAKKHQTEEEPPSSNGRPKQFANGPNASFKKADNNRPKKDAPTAITQRPNYQKPLETNTQQTMTKPNIQKKNH